ncbi:NAD(P)-dependent dehydrogenase (short-subunit alcohol dehydrogenase family) [Streptacidiphilus sp. BW17]|uniref:SDR family NAD(P)-dependent oxidoreductase n=1 Tax=Streptacidiphilus sp. BW17 TaxID=3156274 RepID=UPI003517C922
MSTPRVALVTGATSGLGLALSGALADAGLAVALTGRSRQDAEAAAEALRQRGHQDVAGFALDVTDPLSVSRAVTETRRRFGTVDALVNNAAVAADPRATASTVSLEVFEATLAVNTTGPLRVAQEVLPLMREAGAGRIVNIVSHMASLGAMTTPTSPAYTVSKTALLAVTRKLAAELEADGTGITVNAVSPGQVDTRMSYRPGAQSPQQAAETMLWLLLEEQVPTGGFFHGREPLPW